MGAFLYIWRRGTCSTFLPTGITRPEAETVAKLALQQNVVQEQKKIYESCIDVMNAANSLCCSTVYILRTQSWFHNQTN